MVYLSFSVSSPVEVVLTDRHRATVTEFKCVLPPARDFGKRFTVGVLGEFLEKFQITLRTVHLLTDRIMCSCCSETVAHNIVDWRV